MSGPNPYQSPSSASASTTSNQQLKKTSVLLAILLQFITLGFYAPYWYTSRRKVLNRLGGDEINLGLCIAAFVLNFFYLFTPTPQPDAVLSFSVFYWIVTLSYAIVYLVLAFKVKDILAANYDNDCSGLLTLFFQFLYLQYKINSSELIDEAHQELPANVLGLR